MTARNRTWMSISVILFILVFDQVLKYWIKTSFYPGEARNLIGDWFRFLYVENQGMAFGATFGSGMYAKLFLSIFRLVAVGFGVYYLIQVIRDKEKRVGYILAISLVLAGATGNLLDSAFYDYLFPFNPDLPYNWISDGDSYVFTDGAPQLRSQGFLLGNVVDMFQFNVQYPSWMPFGLAGKDIFSAIWNVADAAIFTGIVIILIRQKAFFPASRNSQNDEAPTQDENQSLESFEQSEIEDDTLS
jgi:signal peptidase II